MSLYDQIEEVLRDKPCFVGVGNYLRGDDAVGLHVVDGILNNQDTPSIPVYNVENVPENFVFKIAEEDCNNVIFIDAVELDAEPGAIIFSSFDEIRESVSDYSTHKLSLSMCGTILEKSNKKTYILGIVPETIDFGEDITEEVMKSATVLIDFIKESIYSNNKETAHERRCI